MSEERERDLDSYTEGVCDGMENMKHEIITLFLAECERRKRSSTIMEASGQEFVMWWEMIEIAARLKGEQSKQAEGVDESKK